MIDLHLHFDGSLPPELLFRLAKEQGITLPAETPEELKSFLSAPVDCPDLNTYLERFALPLQILQTEEALTEAAAGLSRTLAEQGMLYVELRFAPQLHTAKGLTKREVIQAVLDGIDKGPLKTNLILCCMRGMTNQKENEETVRLAAEFMAEKKMGARVAAVDLAGAEALFPTRNYESLFSLVRELSVPYTIHAGEADGPESVKTALSFGTKRVGHGVRAVEDEALVERLKEEGITLECCVTSNLQTKAVPSLEEHPLLKFLRAGVKVTINTDNMTVSDTTIAKELELLRSQGMTETEEKQLFHNAIKAAFLTDAEKEELLEIL